MDWFLYDNDLRHKRVNINKRALSCPIRRRQTNDKGIMSDISGNRFNTRSLEFQGLWQ